jgi:hypothetical protein
VGVCHYSGLRTFGFSGIHSWFANVKWPAYHRQINSVLGANIMNKLIIVIFFMVTAFSCSSEKKFEIGSLPIDSLSPGCGFQFWDQNDTNIIYFDKRLRNDKIKLKINDQIMNITKVKEKINKIGINSFNVGDKTWEVYRENGIELKLEYEVIKVCPDSNSDCESTDYKGNFELNNLKTKKQIKKNLLGNSGC